MALVVHDVEPARERHHGQRRPDASRHQERREKAGQQKPEHQQADKQADRMEHARRWSESRLGFYKAELAAPRDPGPGFHLALRQSLCYSQSRGMRSPSSLDETLRQNPTSGS